MKLSTEQQKAVHQLTAITNASSSRAAYLRELAEEAERVAKVAGGALGLLVAAWSGKPEESVVLDTDTMEILDREDADV